ncbi:MAG TPA: glycosyltransferase [Acidimicrobiales bacterium]|jgi:glycosyltransferase involved in cell wall biosynthesis|nr:glycosyltransferase [Acidimicrobiales bacterium]
MTATTGERVAAPPDPRVAAELARGRAEGGADVLCVASIEPSNAQHELVEALWAYHRLYDGRARLHLVGRTSSYEYARTLFLFVQDLGLATAVRMHGEVSGAARAALYGAADVYLSLSRPQAMSAPVLDAMSAGVPVVSRASEGLGDVATGGALVLAATDPSYVAAALHRVITDERLRAVLEAAGRRRAASPSGNAAADRVAGAIADAVGPQ